MCKACDTFTKHKEIPGGIQCMKCGHKTTWKEKMEM